MASSKRAGVLAHSAAILLLLLGMSMPCLLIEGTPVKNFVSFDGVRCDANSGARKVFKGVTEKSCFNRCRKRKWCTEASYRANKDRCNLFDKDGCDSLEFRGGFRTAGRVHKKTGYWTSPPGYVCDDCGGDFLRVEKPVRTPKKCTRLCDEEKDCKAITWYSDYSSPQWRRACYMWRGALTMRSDPDSGAIIAKKDRATE